MEEFENVYRQETTARKYIDGIYHKNRTLWNIEHTAPDFFRNDLALWQESIYNRLTNLRGETNSHDVAVIVPAYNEEKYILQLLESIASQKQLSNMEVIVVANNCTDRTAEIACACGATVIEYLYEEDNPNSRYAQISHARQRGLEKSQAQYIVTTDADVILPPEFLHTFIEPLQKDNNVVAVGCSSEFYDLVQGDTEHQLRVVDTLGHLLRSRREIIGRTPLTVGWGTAYRRSDALEAGGYQNNRFFSEDIDIGRRLQRFGKLYFNPDTKVWTSSRRVKKAIQAHGIV
ncbi:glycosyltransferase family 2 protein, partial [Candidatus Woesebacteria bacterium]|nr:glycosyltransferase family 2 protein [Candidatus Woesebacteria bacterium]